jgi:hypothetical protein
MTKIERSLKVNKLEWLVKDWKASKDRYYIIVDTDGKTAAVFSMNIRRFALRNPLFSDELTKEQKEFYTKVAGRFTLGAAKMLSEHNNQTVRAELSPALPEGGMISTILKSIGFVYDSVDSERDVAVLTRKCLKRVA